MKILSGKLVLLLAGLGFTVVEAMAFVVSPAAPGAYEPFSIEAVLHPLYQPEPNASIFVEVDGDTILIGHRNIGATFPVAPPPTPSVIQVTGLPPGVYRIKSVEMPASPDGEREEREWNETITIPDTPPTRLAHALFHEGIGHYFVSASLPEVREIVDHGWWIVDFGFNVWPADGPAPNAARPVCRFYSPLVNSHFHTASEGECEGLRSFDSGWNYEGVAFRALVPTAMGCPVGTTPVWRLYNGRFAELDSNHRFVTSVETYRRMIADGWKGEGVAFCSPPG